MALAEAHVAAREATATVAVVERAAQGGRDRPGPGRDFHDAATPIVLHDHLAGVASVSRMRVSAETSIGSAPTKVRRVR